MLRSIAIAAAILCSAAPVGNTETMRVRVVTIEGYTGAAYYSAVEQGYRFIGGVRMDATSEADEQIAMSNVAEPDAEVDPFDAVEGLDVNN